MNVAKLDNQPISDDLIDKLEGQDLMMAYLVAKTTPEQKERIAAKLKPLFSQRTA